jgi:CheY-like chemotaxis protein
MNGDKERCLEAGVNDYTTKPVDPEDLLQTIERWISTDPAPPD